ncbi:IclR family transcriptional regulator [Methylobacterium nodulans]|uniref:Transcriptional regulator, IclR family n=1 Tax=Methylobacterium nodulans (strain LMG 21967 / CNCM I-2342 / ORS 2060) TaxID=460265 RepID=B8IVM6_METNO|nr:IclR family transcriptional regulator [Methylobacterium nodulans]ACL62466.1 transcriptional regulator, IclR family [Methylobacterium nodulans ORS 2060]
MPKEARKRPKLEGVASAERVLTVLTAFRRGDDALELSELARRTSLVKSTIMRLCISLEKFDLIERLDDGRYRLGVEAARIGSVYQQSFALEERVVPVLERLAAESLETASFYIRRGNQRLCLFRADSPYPLRMNVRPGDMRPMDNSAIAQVLSIFGDRMLPKQNDVKLPIYTSGVTDPHVASLAMPIFGTERRLIGALALSGPSSRLTAEQASVLEPRLRDAAERLSSELGAQL